MPSRGKMMQWEEMLSSSAEVNSVDKATDEAESGVSTAEDVEIEVGC
jgi:hypothetical protein